MTSCVKQASLTCWRHTQGRSCAWQAGAGNFSRAVGKGLGNPCFRIIQTHQAVAGNVGDIAAKEEVGCCLSRSTSIHALISCKSFSLRRDVRVHCHRQKVLISQAHDIVSTAPSASHSGRNSGYRELTLNYNPKPS